MAKCFDKGRSLGSGRGHEEADSVDFPWLLRRGTVKRNEG
jgi:hypothetical protein